MGINRPSRFSLFPPLVVALCLLFIASCSETSRPTAAPPAPTVQPADLDKLAQQIRDVRVRLIRHELEQDDYTTAEIDPAEPSYQRVDAPHGFGSFAVSVGDIKAYGDGVRMKLNLGNPSSMGFSAVKLRLRYGPRPPDEDADDFDEQYDKWSEATKEKEETLTADLQPGSWNPVAVTLPGIPASDFGYLTVTVETSRISLQSR